MKRILKNLYMMGLMVALWIPATLWAQDASSDTAGEMVKLNGNSRTYYPDRLGFSPDASMLEVMQMLLNGRSTSIEEVLKNSYIKLDYLPLEMDVVAFLAQLRVSDVEAVTFYTDETVSEASEGLEPTIIIEQRRDMRGKSGYIDTYVTSGQDLKTSARLNYDTDRWKLWGTLAFMSAHEQQEVEKQEAKLPSGMYSQPFTTSTDRRKFDQNAMVFAQYTGRRDVITMYALSHFADSPDIHTEDDDPSTPKVSRKQKRTRWVAQGKWRHYFGQQSNFYTMFRFSTEKEPYTITSTQDVLDHKQNNGFAYNETRLAFNEVPNLAVTLGTDTRFSWDKREVDFQELPVSFSRQSNAVPASYYGLQEYRLRHNDTRPFIEANYTLGPVQLYAGFRTAFVYRSSKGSQQADDFSEHYRNDSWQAMAKWNIDSHHTVTVDYSRRFAEPSVLQNYPALILQPDEKHPLVKGKARFDLPTYQVVDANYSYQKGSFQGLLDVRYFHAKNELVSEPHTVPILENTDVLYYQWKNGEERKGLNVDVKLFWKYRQFLVMNVEGVYSHDRYTKSNSSSDYYYIRLMPVITLPAEFKLTAQLTYHSSINTPVMHEDSFWYGSLQLSKHWGRHWKAYLQWNNVFNQYRTTTELSSDYRVLTRTNRHDNKLTLGLSYQF